MKNITFQKSGKELKEAINIRIAELKVRFDKKDEILNEVLKDKKKVRSYMIRKAAGNSGYEYRNPPIPNKDDIPSEEIEEISQLCERINQIEQEINKLKLMQSHLSDDEVFDIELADLIRYGFKILD